MQRRTDFNGPLAQSDAEATNQTGFKMSNEMDNLSGYILIYIT